MAALLFYNIESCALFVCNFAYVNKAYLFAPKEWGQGVDVMKLLFYVLIIFAYCGKITRMITFNSHTERKHKNE